MTGDGEGRAEDVETEGGREEGREGGRKRTHLPSSLIRLCQWYFSRSSLFIWSFKSRRRCSPRPAFWISATFLETSCGRRRGGRVGGWEGGKGGG